MLKDAASLRAALAAARRFDEIPIGPRIPPLRGTAFNGSPLEFDPQGAKWGSVLFIYSRHCKPSNENWQAWEDLMRPMASEGRDLIFVDLGGTTDRVFVRRHRLEGYPLFIHLSKESSLVYKFPVTPETILVNSIGVIQRIWSGRLSAADVKGIRSIVQGGAREKS